MKPEQIDSMRRHAAEVVMDCYRGADTKTTLEYYYFSNCTIGRIAVVDWRPDEDANQVLMLLEQFEWYKYNDHSGNHVVRVLDKPNCADAVDKSFPLAALVAVCRATGWQE